MASGDLRLTDDEAQQLTRAIGSGASNAFSDYLGWEWKILPKPGFDHPNLAAIWQAEQALQQLNDLKDDPELKDAFVKQANATFYKHLRPNFVAAAQFPQTLTDAQGTFTKPQNW